MCLLCHQKISNEQIIHSFKDELINKNFELYNTTSINHFILAYLGANGTEAQELSKQLLNEYVNYKKSRSLITTDYLSTAPSVEYVIKEIRNADIKKEFFKGKTTEQIRNELFSDIPNL